MQNISIRLLNQDQLDLATHIVCKSFLENNKVWISLNSNSQKYQTLYQSIKSQIDMSYQKKLIKGLFINQKLVGIANAHQIMDYIKTSNKQEKSQILQTLKKYGRILEHSLEEMQHEPTTVYLRFISILPEYSSKSLAEYFYLKAMLMTYEQYGYKIAYARITNPIVKKLSERAGGSIINAIKTDKQQQIYLAKIDMSKIPPPKPPKEYMIKSSL